MADLIALRADARPGTGKGAARRLRSEGRVPAIAYGSGVAPTPLSVDALALYHVLHTAAGENAVINLEVDGDSHLALAREIQRHPVRREVVHVDFVTVDRTVAVHVDVPLHLEGEPVGVTEGGVLSQAAMTLEIEVLPLEVPNSLTVDVSGLAIGDRITAGEVALPDGVTLLTDPEAVILSVTLPTVEEEPEEEEVEAAEEEGEGATAEEAAGRAADEGGDSKE